jgi:putative inorganic carbon (HCO3(-)) transporter
MPLIVTTYNGEIFYNGKIMFSFFITFLFVSYVLIFDNDNFIDFKDKITYYILVYSLLLFLSFLFSIDKKVSLLGQPHSREGFIELILYLIVFYIFYKYFTLSLKVIEAILIVSVIISIVGLLQFANILPFLTAIVKNPWELGTPFSTIGNRNFVGTFCTIIMPVAIGFWFFTSKIQGYFYVGIIFCFLLISQTRSAWIAFLVYFSMFFILNFKNKKLKSKWLIVLFSIFILSILINYLSNDQLNRRLSLMLADLFNISDDSAGSNRMLYWKRTIPHLFNRPLFGYGIDTFGVFNRKFYGWIDIYYEKVHNEYMQIALTMGFPVLIMYLSLVFKIILGLLKKATTNPISQVMFLCIIGYLTQAMFNLSMLPNAILYWAILGAAYKQVKYPVQ